MKTKSITLQQGKIDNDDNDYNDFICLASHTLECTNRLQYRLSIITNIQRQH